MLAVKQNKTEQVCKESSEATVLDQEGRHGFSEGQAD